MSEYKPLSTETCAAVRWLASECVLNKTAASAGRDALLDAMPPDAFADQDPAQMAFFWSVYGNQEMGIVIISDWWPTYERERKEGRISGDAEPWN